MQLSSQIKIALKATQRFSTHLKVLMEIMEHHQRMLQYLLEHTEQALLLEQVIIQQPLMQSLKSKMQH